MFMECILNDSHARFKPFRVAQPNFFDERDEDEVEVEAAGGRRRRSRRSLWDERTGPWTGGFQWNTQQCGHRGRTAASAAGWNVLAGRSLGSEIRFSRGWHPVKVRVLPSRFPFA